MNTRTSTKHTETVIAAGHHYTCEFRKRRGGYLVRSPQFLPLATWGETLDAAREKAKEQIEAFLEYDECREFL